MAVYFGVMKNNRVELEGEVPISDGARVEVPLPPGYVAPDEEA